MSDKCAWCAQEPCRCQKCLGCGRALHSDNERGSGVCLRCDWDEADRAGNQVEDGT